MSVAGILAGTLFSGAGSQLAQKTPLSTINTSNTPSAFSAFQQTLSQSGSVPAPGKAPVSSELTQLGQDLKSGNLPAAQADYSALSMSIAQGHAHMSGQLHSGSAASGNNSQAGASGASSTSGNLSNPMAAMLAYSSLQLSPAARGLSSSLMTPASTFSIDA